MKEVKLSKTESFDSRVVLVHVLRQPGRGMDLEEMRRRVKVLTILDKAKGTKVQLEDADYNVLKAAVLEHKWPMADPELLEMIETVLDSKELAKNGHGQ